MRDFFLQIQSQDSVQSSFSENVSSFVERVNPLQLPHETFVTDLAIIMILAAIVTLAFFKIRQPLIIGYLFAGMLICLLYTSPSPRDKRQSRMPSSA